MQYSILLLYTLLVLLVLIVQVAVTGAQPTNYPSLSPHSISIISTIAGTGMASYSGDGGVATSATMNGPSGIAIDSNGNVYVSDFSNRRVRKVTVSTGIITTYAGTGTASYSGDGGVASSATLNGPNGLCMDTSGNLYIGDSFNHRIRKVTASTGVISTYAGAGTASYSGDNGVATSATLYSPSGVAVDSSGNVYIGDSSNHRVRKITASTSVITTIAGTGTSGYSGDNGQATAASIANPQGVNLDSSGNVYFGDFSGYNVIRKVAVSTGVISTVAGTGSTSGGYNGDNIQATAAMLYNPHDVVFDSAGNMYISDGYNNRIRKVDMSTGVITTVVGTGSASSTGDGSAASSAAIYVPYYSRFDSSGDYYISEIGGNRIRKVMTISTDIPTATPTTLVPTSATPSRSPTSPTMSPTYYPSSSPHSISIISTYAGTGAASYSGDNGQATSATMNSPIGIALDSSGNVYVSDYYNNRVRKITSSTGIITTYAGTGASTYSGDGGAATSATLNGPNGLAIDTSGNLYIGDSSNHRIRKVTASTGVISTYAGTGSTSYSGDGGAATSATLNNPVGVAVDSSGNVYIGDCYNNRIRKIIASTSIIQTIAGTGIAGFSGNSGQATAANIQLPVGVNLDSSLNVYFGDFSYNVIRKVTVSTGVISTVAGTGSTSGGYNGDNIQATAAMLNNPIDVVIDSYSNLYITERGNNRIRKVTVSTGVITTVVGTGSASSTGDGGTATSATTNGPCYIRFDSSGNFYITECDGNRIRKVVTVSTDIPTVTPTYYPSLSPHSISIISTYAGTGTGSYSGDGGVATSAAINNPAGIAIDSNGNVYFSDMANHRVRKIATSTGIISTYAGSGSASYGGDGGVASSAALYQPNGLSIDSSGNLYIADQFNHRVRKVTASTSVISTVAGTGSADFSGDNGQATSSTLNYPTGVAVDTSGNVYIGDYYNRRVRKILASTGVITTIAGTGSSGYSGDGGPATAADIGYPSGVNLDTSVNVYFSVCTDYHVIRKVTISTGVISTMAGTDSTLGGAGNLYISDLFNYRVRKVDVSTGVITTIVGTGTASSTGDGSAATSATTNGPCFSRFDSSGNYYISESIGHRIRKVVTVSTAIPTAIPTASPTTAAPTSPNTDVITTIAGTGASSYNGDNGQATAAGLAFPQGVAVDASGNIYIADTINSRIRKVTVSTGIITTIAGTGASTYSGDNGQATSATLNIPSDVALDSAGNIYIADSSNHRVRKVTFSTGIISTFAGTGTSSYSGDNGQATSAALSYPFGVELDSAGNVYIADSANNRIRKVTVSTGIITTYAGTGSGSYSGDNGPATAAALNDPYRVAVDSSGNVYIADSLNSRIRKVTASTGIITTYAGTGSISFSGDNGPATSATIYYPHGVALDAADNVYISDYGNNRIRKVTVLTGIITTIAGTGTSSYSGDGGAATSATLKYPLGVALDASGNVYIADCTNSRIRKVTVPTSSSSVTPTLTPTLIPSTSAPSTMSPNTDIITTFAGSSTSASYSGDNGPASSAGLHLPHGVAVDASGNVYIADTINHRIRKVTISTGIITTIAGNGGSGSYSGDNGLATSATLNQPSDVAVDTTGNIYIADTYNYRIRKVTVSTGIITALAGTGTASYSGDNIQATSAALSYPYGVALDSAGNVYIADCMNNRVRKVTVSTGIITTIAGTGSTGYSGDNGPATSATMKNPYGVAVDSTGNVYIADSYNYRIRKVTVSTGIISTYAGTGTSSYSGDNGPATAAAVKFPRGVTLDTAGNVYISDSENNRVRKVTASTGIITTIAGNGASNYSGDNGPATAATLTYPIGISLDSSGNVYIADAYNNRIRKVTVSAASPSATPTVPPTLIPSSSAPSTMSPNTDVITTIAGSSTSGSYSGDNGPATSATLNSPGGVSLDSAGNVYIADSNNNRVRKLTVSTGIITTIAGTGTGSFSGDNGQATSATLRFPYGLALDASGNVYIADTNNERIRKVTVATGIITTIAGTGTASYSGDNGAATSAELKYLTGVALDSAGNVYIADMGNNRIRKVTVSTGIITTIAGTGTGNDSGDNGPATSAALNNPLGVALDSAGNIYIADQYNCRVRKVTVSTGIIITIAGTGSPDFIGDNGPATSATLYYPNGVSLDVTGNVYIADRYNHRIRKVTVSTGIITTIAGTGSASYSGDNGAATSAALRQPYGVSVDTSGNVYIADTNNNRIRKVTVSTASPSVMPTLTPTLIPSMSTPSTMSPSTDVITTLAGSSTSGGFSGDGGQATSALIKSPAGVALDSTGNVYFADSSNHRIRKVAISTGIITTIAGSSTSGGFSGDGGQATSALINTPIGVALDSTGNVYIADQYNNRIRKVTVSTSIISTIAGSSTSSSYSGDNGQATSARLYGPCGVSLDSSGNLYFADTNNHRIRKVTVSTGIITTFAGTGTSSYSGDNGNPTSAALNFPTDVTLDTSGNVYIADYFNNRIRKVTASTGFITTVAGTGSTIYSGDNGPATSATLNWPSALDLDSSGNIYIADYSNSRIRKVTVSTGIITTIAGTGASGYSGDNGPATSATINYPQDVAVDSSGNVYISDTSNQRIRKVVTVSSTTQPSYTPTLPPTTASSLDIITTIAGTGASSYSGDNGAATSAEMSNPFGITLDSSGNVYISDNSNQRVRKVTVSMGIITTIAGTGTMSFSGDGGQATAAALFYPAGLVIDSSGNVYIADSNNHRIRKVTVSTGIISTVAGSGTSGSYSGDNGQATAATLCYPCGVALDASGNIYIADLSNNRIRKVAVSTGIITTIAGTGTGSYSGDNGPATSATLKSPSGVVLDASGNVYIVDRNNHCIRKVTASTGIIATIAGSSGIGSYSGDNGQATSAGLNGPRGLSLDSIGNVYIADYSNNRIRKVTVSTGIITTIAGSSTSGSYSGDGGLATSANLYNPVDVALDTSGNVYIADFFNQRVRKVTIGGTFGPTLTPTAFPSIPTFTPTYSPTTKPSSSTPTVMSTPPSSADTSSPGIISTLIGYCSGDDGAATNANIIQPTSVVLDTSGSMYIGSYYDYKIRKVTSTGTISSIVGSGIGTGTSGSIDGSGTSASVNIVYGLALDSSNNVYIADTGNSKIRKLTVSTGIVSTYACIGLSTAYSNNVAATSSGCYYTYAVALDSSNNVYIGDTFHNQVRKVTASTGIITAFAGTGTTTGSATGGYSGDNGQATAAQLYRPCGLALDSSGNVYISDTLNFRIRKVTISTGVITTIAGAGTSSYNGDNIAATSASLNQPYGVTLDASGNVYIAEFYNYRIRKVTMSTGIISTIAGTGNGSYTGDGGQATSASIANPVGLYYYSSSSSVYIGDFGSCVVRKISSTGVISTVAGHTYDTTQSTSLALSLPEGVAVDSSGNVYVSEYSGHKVKKMTVSTGIVSDIAGTGSTTSSGDGAAATSAGIYSPSGLALDASGNVYIAETLGYRIRKLTVSTGIISTVVGTGSTGSCTSGSAATSTTCKVNSPMAVEVDSSGNVYYSDTLNYKVMKYTASTGIVTTIAGSGSSSTGGDGGAATSAGINKPYGFVFDASGNIIISEYASHKVRKVTVATGFISTIAGTGTSSYSGDGGQASSATLYNPTDVAIDSYGDIYISDSGNNMIRKITVSTGIISTIAGSSTSGSYTGNNVQATSATFNTPFAIAVDSANNIYITDATNGAVRKIVGVTSSPTYAPTVTPSTSPTTILPTLQPSFSVSPTFFPSLSPHSASIISTIAGTGVGSYSGDGGQATSASINNPLGIAIDSSGNVYFSDHINQRVRKITTSTGIITTYAGTGSATYNGDGGAASSAAFSSPNGLCIDSSDNLYIGDYGNSRVRKISASTSIVSTIAGTGASSYSGDNGQATSAALALPVGVAVDTAGNVYIGDSRNHRIRKVSVSTGIITTIAGTGSYGYSGDNGQATSATIAYPHGINLDSAGNVYFGDSGAYNVVRKITVSTGVISTVAGTGSTSGGYNGDSIQATSATLNWPHDVVVRSNGDLYICDWSNNRVRKVDASTGIISTVVGDGTASSTGDGSIATAAAISIPGYSRFDSSGNYYISEFGGHRVRKIVTITTEIPTVAPTVAPTVTPTIIPTSTPSMLPTSTPSVAPTTAIPTLTPTVTPTIAPTIATTTTPTEVPSATPSYAPTLAPSNEPSAVPSTEQPSHSPSCTPTSFPTSLPTSTPTFFPTKRDNVAANLLSVPLSNEAAKEKINYYLGAFVGYFLAIYVCLYLYSFLRYGKATATKLYDSAYQSNAYVKNSAAATSELVILSDLRMKNEEVAMTRLLEDELASVKAVTTKSSDRESSNTSAKNSLYSISVSEKLDSIFTTEDENKYSKGYREYMYQERTLLGCSPFLYPEGYAVKIPCVSREVVLPPGRMEDLLLYICHNHPLFTCFYFMDGSKLGAHGTRILYIGKDVAVFVLYQFSNMLLQYYMLDGQGLGTFINLFIITPSAVSVGLLLKYLYTCPFTETVEFQRKYAKYQSTVIFLGRLAILPIMVIMFSSLIIACLFSSNRDVPMILVNYFVYVQFYGIVLAIAQAVLLFIDGYYYKLSLFGVLDVLCIGQLYKERILAEQLMVDVDYAYRIRTYFCGLIKVQKILNRDDAIKAKWITVVSDDTADIEMTGAADSDDGIVVRSPLSAKAASQRNSASFTFDAIHSSNNDEEVGNYSTFEGDVSSEPVVVIENPIHASIRSDQHVKSKSLPSISQTESSEADDDAALYLEYQSSQHSNRQDDSVYDTSNDESEITFEEWKTSKKQFKQGTRGSFVKAFQVFEEREQLFTSDSSKVSASVANTMHLQANFKVKNVLATRSTPAAAKNNNGK